MVPVSVEVLSGLFQRLALDEPGVILPEAVGADNHGHRREGSENQDECPQDLSFHGLQSRFFEIETGRSDSSSLPKESGTRGHARVFFDCPKMDVTKEQRGEPGCWRRFQGGATFAAFRRVDAMARTRQEEWRG